MKDIKRLCSWCMACDRKDSSHCRICLTRTFSFPRTEKPKLHDAKRCGECGSVDYYAKGLCVRCYMKQLHKDYRKERGVSVPKEFRQSGKIILPKRDGDIVDDLRSYDPYQELIDKPKRLRKLMEES